MFLCNDNTINRLDLLKQEMVSHKCLKCSIGRDDKNAMPKSSRGFGRIMIIADKPEFRERHNTEGFKSALGSILEKNLRQHAGLEMDRDCYVTFAFKCIDDIHENKSPIKDQRACVSTWLMKEIKLVDPVLIIFLNKEIADLVLGSKQTPVPGKIVEREFRGFRHNVVLIRNPALTIYTKKNHDSVIKTHLNYIQYWLSKHTEEFSKELSKEAYRIGCFQEYYNNRKYTVVDTVEKFKELRDLVLQHDIIGLDTETTGLDTWRADFEIVGVCVAVDHKHGYYIPVNHCNSGGSFTSSLVKNIDFIKYVKPFLLEIKGFDHLKVFHNFSYDHRVLMKYGIDYSEVDLLTGHVQVEDTMIMQYLLDENKAEKGLKPLISGYFGIISQDFTTAAAGKKGGDIARAFQHRSPYDVAQYAGDDACNVLLLHKFLKPRLKEHSDMYTGGKLLNNIYPTEIATAAIVGEATDTGVRIDVDYYKELCRTVDQDLAELSEHLLKICNVFSFTSQQQVISLIRFVVNDLIILDRFEEKFDGLDAQKTTLLSLMSFYRKEYELADTPIGRWTPDKLDDYITTGLRLKKLEKVKSTYLEPIKRRSTIETAANGIKMYIVHPEFTTVHTTTGRMSSMNPNFQNIPRDSVKIPSTCEHCGAVLAEKDDDGQIIAYHCDSNIVGSTYVCHKCRYANKTYTYDIRRMLIPREGKTFVASDWTSMEIMATAAVSGDQNLLHVVNKMVNDPDSIEGDMHSITAAKVGGYSLSDFEKMLNSPDKDIQKIAKDLRQTVKPVNFGVLYGISALGLMAQFRANGDPKTEEECQAMIDGFFSLYPEVKKMAQETAHLVRTQGMVVNSHGRIRHAPKDADESMLRSVNNFIIQGDCASVLKEVLTRMKSVLKKLPRYTKTILFIHDEVINETDPAIAREVAYLMKEYMEITLKAKASVKLKTEPEYDMDSLSKTAKSTKYSESDYVADSQKREEEECLLCPSN